MKLDIVAALVYAGDFQAQSSRTSLLHVLDQWFLGILHPQMVT